MAELSLANISPVRAHPDDVQEASSEEQSALDEEEATAVRGIRFEIYSPEKEEEFDVTKSKNGDQRLLTL